MNIALTQSSGVVTNQMDRFQAEFLPIPTENDTVLNVLLTVIGVSASLLSAGVWNRAKPAIQGVSNPKISGSADFFKDATNGSK